MTPPETDPEDRLLRSLLESEPLVDAGFTQRVVARVQRRLWLERLAVPVAAVVGAAIAAKPVARLSEGAALAAADAVGALCCGAALPALFVAGGLAWVLVAAAVAFPTGC